MNNERIKQIGALLLNNCEKCGKNYYSDEFHVCKNLVETNNASIIGRASECERCAELEKQNRELESENKDLSETVERLENKCDELQKELAQAKRKQIGQITRGGKY